MELLEAFEAYSDIAKPIILKLDMMRVGIKVTQAMLDEVSESRQTVLARVIEAEGAHWHLGSAPSQD